jgi:hypothetical protein
VLFDAQAISGSAAPSFHALFCRIRSANPPPLTKTSRQAVLKIHPYCSRFKRKRILMDADRLMPSLEMAL